MIALPANNGSFLEKKPYLGQVPKYDF